MHVKKRTRCFTGPEVAQLTGQLRDLGIPILEVRILPDRTVSIITATTSREAETESSIAEAWLENNKELFVP